MVHIFLSPCLNYHVGSGHECSLHLYGVSYFHTTPRIPQPVSFRALFVFAEKVWDRAPDLSLKCLKWYPLLKVKVLKKHLVKEKVKVLKKHLVGEEAEQVIFGRGSCVWTRSEQRWVGGLPIIVFDCITITPGCWSRDRRDPEALVHLCWVQLWHLLAPPIGVWAPTHWEGGRSRGRYG